MYLPFSLHSRTARLVLTGLLLAVMLLAFTRPARADIGPKPTMGFDFESESGEPFAIVSGEQLECKLADCSDAQPLMEAGPQRFTCTEAGCSSTAYGYSDYHRLRITFADGRVLESNVFGNSYFDAKYKVTVRANDLLVEELRGGVRPLNFYEILQMTWIYGALCTATGFFLVVVIVTAVVAKQQAVVMPGKRAFVVIAWILAVLGLLGGIVLSTALPVTALIEAVIAWIYARLRKLPAFPVITALTFANFFTLPVLWFIVRLAAGEFYWAVLLVGEVLVWMVESAILFAVLRKNIRWWDAVLLAFLANMVSFLVGLLLPV